MICYDLFWENGSSNTCKPLGAHGLGLRWSLHLLKSRWFWNIPGIMGQDKMVKSVLPILQLWSAMLEKKKHPIWINLEGWEHEVLTRNWFDGENDAGRLRKGTMMINRSVFWGSDRDQSRSRWRPTFSDFQGNGARPVSRSRVVAGWGMKWTGSKGWSCKPSNRWPPSFLAG